VSGAEHGVESVYELSPLQEGLLVESLANPGAGLYVEQVVLDLAGPLVPSALAHAWREAVARHPILRTSFHWQGLQRPVQAVHRSVEVPVAHNDLRSLRPDRREQALRWFLGEDRARGFRFDRAPLLRVTMLRLGGAAYRVVVTLHHILLDGWSVGIVVDEVARLYRRAVDGVPCRLADARPFGDYVAWLHEQDRAAAESYWRSALHGVEEPPPLALLGSGRAAHGPRRFEFAEHERAVPPAVDARVRALARERRITTNVAVLGAWAAVLGAELRTDDLVVGAVVSGRDAPLERVDTVVGLCINTVPVRVRIEPEQPVAAWLAGLHREQLESRDFQHCALTDVHGWSGVPRGRPLFESVFIFENHATLQRPAAGRALASRAFERTSYPLTVLVGVVPELSLRVLYDASVLGREAVERLTARLVRALEAIADDPDAPVASLVRPSGEEARLVRELGEGPAAPLPRRPLHELVAERARRSPDAPAVVEADRMLTLGELDRRSDALARRIVETGPGSGAGRPLAVGVLLPRSAALAVAVLGVLKAGAVYLPLEPALPRERLRFLLEDSAAPLVVTNGSLRDALPAWRGLVLDVDETAAGGEEPLPAVPLDAPAWFLFTSGSTGVPKGVLGSHLGLVNRLAWGERDEPFAADDVCCLKTRIAFVDSLWELLGPLSAGVPLVVADERAAQDPRELAALLAREGVTRLVAVPSLLAALVEAAPDALAASRLRRVTSSGEPLTADLARRLRALLPGCVLVNMYGSTEVTADATRHVVASAEGPLVPVGRPLVNTRVRVLDRRGEPVPPGAVGERHVGGACLAIGYAGGATGAGDERFLPDPLLPGEGLYRTGDLARWRADGELELVGRADRQLKIRGVRVEPDEVERALCAHPAVREAAVVGRDGAAGTELVAFVAGGAAPDELRSFLRERLPEQLVPALVVAVDGLPRLPSGKPDRVALAERGGAAAPATGPASPPRTTAERLVAEAVADTLGLPQVGALDDFFALGGHSLLATRLATALGSRFALAVPLAWIFEHPVVEDLARTIEGALVAEIRERERVAAPAGAAGA